MTVRKHLKQLVRERMTKTGESYTSARRFIIRQASTNAIDPALRWHFPGNIAATTALRVLLAHAGVVDPHTKKPFTEAMLFGIAGGIGVGVCAFHYAKADVSSFCIMGRHLWYEDTAYLKEAAARFGLTPVVKETSGAKAADKQLREMVAAGTCVAWVDMAHLPHRALPQEWSGGGYHVVTVYKIADDSALIGDMTDEPVSISLKDLAVSRARIKKQKHRLLTLKPTSKPVDLKALVAAGLHTCQKSLTGSPMKGYPNMFNLNAFRQWADRLHGSKDSQSWDRTFPRGINLWRGLTSMHRFIEHYGTGGGLCRPMFAEFLDESAKALGDARLGSLTGAYAKIGKEWTALAEAALPENIPLLKRARQCHDRYAELLTSGGSVEDKRAVWAELDQLGAQAKDNFPLSAGECVELRQHLQKRVNGLIQLEQNAYAELSAVASAMN